MLAWVAALLFACAAVVAGGGLSPTSPLLSWQTLACAGMTFLALHAAGAGGAGRR
jgi:hypothetical protein